MPNDYEWNPQPSIDDLLQAIQEKQAKVIFVSPSFMPTLCTNEIAKYERCTERHLLVLGYFGSIQGIPIIMHRSIKVGFRIVGKVELTISEDFWDRDWGAK